MNENLGKRLQDLQVRMLSPGAEMERLAAKFSILFQETLEDYADRRGSPTGLLYRLQEAMLEASTTTLMGPHAIHMYPDFAKTYWDFDEALLLGLPEYTRSEGGSIRTQFLDAISRYVESAQRSLHAPEIVEVDRHFGSRLFRSCVRELSARMPNASAAQKAHHLVPLVWATGSNAIPATVWILMELLQRPALVPRLRAEATSAAFPKRRPHLITFDLIKLGKLPLLNSLYLEVLRTRTSVTVSRPLAADMEIAGYTLTRGNHVMAPSWMAHMDREIWDMEGHSPEEFWPERFLPAFEGNSSDGSRNEAGEAQNEARERLARAMRAENFFPYGGGSAICPGRHFSKYEILIAVAVMILEYDFEVLGYIDANERKIGGQPEPRQEYGGGGVMPPDRDMLVTISKRNEGSPRLDVK